MNRIELAKFMAILATNYSSFVVNEPKLQLWGKLLEDITYNVAEVIAEKIICENPYPPTMNDVRRTANEVLKASINKVDAGQAFGEVMKAVSIYGTYRTEEALESLSPITREVVKILNWNEICLSENLDVLRGQFMRIYNEKLQRISQNNLLPPGLSQQIKQISDNFKVLDKGNK